MIGRRGAGEHFCAGADIGELSGLDSPSAAGEHACLGQAACNALEQAPVPIVAAIQGFCGGGGLDLAMSCNPGQPRQTRGLAKVELGIGSIAAWGGIRRLPRLVGVAAAKDLVFSARHLDAEEAVARGLVSDVVTDGDLVEAARRRTEHLLTAPRLALAASKRALDHWVDVPLAAGLEDDRETFARLVEGDELQAGPALSRALGPWRLTGSRDLVLLAVTCNGPSRLAWWPLHVTSTGENQGCAELQGSSKR